MTDTPVSDSARIGHLGHTKLDLDRMRRLGMPEAVFASGKTVEQCIEIVSRLRSQTDDPIIVTRATGEQKAELLKLQPDSVFSNTLTWQHLQPLAVSPAVVVSGGTSDQFVLDEAVATLQALGVPTRSVRDVGVAGLHRVLDSLEEFSDASVVLVVAGMEGSLSTVLAGLIPNPIIAVPTSVGYGSSLEGVTALLSALASCAPGMSVVGIDNGYGAACAAVRMLHMTHPLSEVPADAQALPISSPR
ncbi:MAG: nickel pincer cofactor biosynthesis protein LarB [Actinomycetes bacterium]